VVRWGRMRLGCLSIILLVFLGAAGGAAWAGRRALQEPEISANLGTADDGLKGQQKIFQIARSEADRPRGRSRSVVVTEPELNAFLSRHLSETEKIPLTIATVRLLGDGRIELKGRLLARHLLAAWPVARAAELLPQPSRERPLWLHLGARASLEVGTARGQRKYLRLEVERFALGRQPLPRAFLSLLVSPETLNLLRWRIPGSVEGITIEPGAVVVRVAS
jgi:hypothetical protein